MKRRFFGSILALMLFSLRTPVAGAATSPGTASGAWSMTPSMQAPLMSHQAALLHDGRVLVLGGELRPGNGPVLAHDRTTELFVVSRRVPLSAYAAQRPLVSRTTNFHATYRGTLLIGKTPYVATRKDTGNASILGRSSLVASDRVAHNVRNDSDATCVAVAGEGALRTASGDIVKFLYLLGGCGMGTPVSGHYAPFGHYFIYGGTGTFSQAHGQGTIRETGKFPFGTPGESSPITDTFSGTLFH